jgi:hypothetical protein
MSNNEMKDIPPILPLRQNEEPANTIISTALTILDRHQYGLSQSNEYTLIRFLSDIFVTQLRTMDEGSSITNRRITKQQKVRRQNKLRANECGSLLGK